MFLRGLNTDDRKICIPEKILFFPISEGRLPALGRMQAVGPHGCWLTAWDAMASVFRPCSGSLGILTKL